MRYASIDIETTGLNPDTDQVLQIACVIDGPEYQDRDVSSLPHLKITVNHERIVGHPFALSMNAGILKSIAEGQATDEGKVDSLLSAFLETYLDKGRITAAGKNFGSFDRQFLRRLTPQSVSLLHHRCLDPGSLYARADDRCPPSSDDCIIRMLNECPVMAAPRITHDALDDARAIVHLIRHRLFRKSNV